MRPSPKELLLDIEFHAAQIERNLDGLSEEAHEQVHCLLEEAEVALRGAAEELEAQGKNVIVD